MKAEEFISEERMDPAGPAKWVQLIKRDCQPYIQEMKGKPLTKFPLYRGVTGGERKEFLKKRVRLDDRDPMDTAPEIHKEINQYFVKEYGAPFRNAMFCTGSRTDAKQYGDLYYVFPIGQQSIAKLEETNDKYLTPNILDPEYLKKMIGVWYQK